MSPGPEPPSNLRSLTTRIDNLARQRGRPVRRIQRAVANTVVGQMLPAGVVKGGTAMKLRVGEARSRFTPDLDAARSANVSLDDYLTDLGNQLAQGWAGFTGTVVEFDAPQPEGVPEEYVMQPFEIRLSYQSRHWLTVAFDLAATRSAARRTRSSESPRTSPSSLDDLGLEIPAPIPVLAVEHQVAQKLHACTAVSAKTGSNERAHDLVDLQILDQEENIDMAAVGATARRLFAARHGHSWPPTVIAFAGWATIYTEAADGLDVMGNVDDAVAWANAFIARATH